MRGPLSARAPRRAEGPPVDGPPRSGRTFGLFLIYIGTVAGGLRESTSLSNKLGSIYLHVQLFVG